MNGKIIVVAHQKGGVGKSTITSNLAVELSKQFQTAIVDLDIQKSLGTFVSVRKQKNSQSLDVIQVSNSSELIKIMDRHSKGILLIDTGGYDFDLQRIAMLGADMIITPVSDSPMELHGLSVFAKTLKELKTAKKDLKANVVFNRVHQFANKSIIDLKNDIATLDVFNVFDVVIVDRKIYKEAFFYGQSVCEYHSKSKADHEISLLIQEIKNNILL